VEVADCNDIAAQQPSACIGAFYIHPCLIFWSGSHAPASLANIRLGRKWLAVMALQHCKIVPALLHFTSPLSNIFSRAYKYSLERRPCSNLARKYKTSVEVAGSEEGISLPHYDRKKFYRTVPSSSLPFLSIEGERKKLALWGIGYKTFYYSN
jgi:hypothetical protein